MRAVPPAVATVVVVLLLLAGTARAAGPTDFLAPPRACAGATEVGTSVAVQRRALVCLVNWARRRAGLRRLSQHRALGRSAALKAATIVSCRDFSHAPCGHAATAAAAAVGYRYAFWAENLYWGSYSLGTPYAAMRAWLLSPPHRRQIFARAPRDLGIGRLQMDSFAGASQVTLWVLAMGRRQAS